MLACPLKSTYCLPFNMGLSHSTSQYDILNAINCVVLLCSGNKIKTIVSKPTGIQIKLENRRRRIYFATTPIETEAIMYYYGIRYTWFIRHLDYDLRESIDNLRKKHS